MMASTRAISEHEAAYRPALEALAGMDQDMAGQHNAVGFSAADTRFGHDLVNQAWPWTPRQCAAVHKLLKRYASTQLPSLGFDFAALPAPPDAAPRPLTPGTPVARPVVRKPAEAPTIRLDPEAVGTVACVRWPYADPQADERYTLVRRIPGAQWHPGERHWIVPVNETSVPGLAALIETFAGGDGAFRVDAALAETVQTVGHRLHETLEASRAADADIHIMGMLDSTLLRPFQRAGIAYLLRHRKVVLADDMGTGKSVQSIATVTTAGCQRILVVCPASLKLNWKREILQWTGEAEHEITIFEGSKPTAPILPRRWSIVNYDVLDGWKDALVQEPWDAVICDECFPYETLIATDQGDIPIGEIVEQALPVRVLSYNTSTNALEYKPIARWLRKVTTKRMVRVTHEYGSFDCTEDHKIWTDSGWQKAGTLRAGENLRVVRNRVSDARHLGGEEEPVLQQGMFGQAQGERSRVLPQAGGGHAGSPALEDGEDRSGGVRADEAKQPDARSGSASEDASFAEGADVPGTGRQRQDDATAGADCCGAGITDGTRHSNASGSGPIRESPAVVQGGHRGPGSDAGNRNRRQDAPDQAMAIPGSEEDGSAECARVVRIEVLEPRGGQRSGSGDSEDQVVYDLEVEDNHTYFANGVAVSNCHMLKSGTKVKRGKAATAILKAAKPKHILMLTGTPVLNRPIELYPLLEMLGRAQEFGGKKAYMERYCDLTYGRFGMDASGASNLDELNLRLRSGGMMIRRRKQDILKELPPRIWSPMPVAMTPAQMRVYDAAEAALQAAIEVGEPGAVLVRISELRQLAARMKLDQAGPWIESMLESGEKLVVMAWHREITDEVARRYNAPKIVGGQNRADIEEGKRRFQQDDDCRIISCNIAAGGVGHTLTAASNVLFLEQAWNGALMDQALDRCLLEGTRVATPDGWRAVEDIRVGDEVIGRYGTPRRVLDTWSKGATHDRVMAEITISGRGTITTTADHRFLTRDERWLEAQELRPGDDLMMADTAPGEDQDMECIPFPDEYRRADRFVNGAGSVQRSIIEHAPDRIDLTDEALFAFGYFIGDGYTHWNGEYPSAVVFAGNTTTKQVSLDRVSRWVASVGRTMQEEYVRGQSAERRFSSAEWAMWFRGEFGHRAENKRIPRWMFDLSPRQKGVVLEGMAASDGYDRDGHGYIEYVTASEVLAGQMVPFVAASGYRPSSRRQTTGHAVIGWMSGEERNGRPGRVQSVTLRHPRKARGLRERVYDITVEHDAAFMAEGVVVHNCHRIGQEADSVTGWVMTLEHPQGCETIDEYMQDMVSGKRRVTTETADGQGEARQHHALDRMLGALRQAETDELDGDEDRAADAA